MKNRLVVIGIALAAMSAFAACDDPSVGSQQAAQSPIPEQSAQDPNIRESVTAAPDFDAGHTVHITTVGIQPKALASSCCNPILFKNETTGTVTVIFNISKKNSGPIAPGSTWQWQPPNPESVIYHLGNNPALQGQIQIEGND